MAFLGISVILVILKSPQNPHLKKRPPRGIFRHYKKGAGPLPASLVNGPGLDGVFSYVRYSLFPVMERPGEGPEPCSSVAIAVHS